MKEFPKWVYKGVESKLIQSKEDHPKGWVECPKEALEKAKKEALEKAKKEALEKAKKEALEKAKKEALEKAKKEASK